MIDLINKMFIQMQTRRGMESLEWIAIAAAFIVVLFFAYQAFGGSIRDIGTDIINDLA